MISSAIFDSTEFFDTPLESGKNTWDRVPLTPSVGSFTAFCADWSVAKAQTGWISRMNNITMNQSRMLNL